MAVVKKVTCYSTDLCSRDDNGNCNSGVVGMSLISFVTNAS